jgi:hypothetical protein
MPSIIERLDHRLERKARYDRKTKQDREYLRVLHDEIDTIVQGAEESLKWRD